MSQILTTSARLTTKAAAKLKEMHGDSAGTILHLSTAGQTCCGMRYEIAFADQVQDGYSVSEVDGVRLVVDPASLPYCEDATVDFVETPEGSGFTVETPALVGGSCACGGQ